jgi:hypothetical protein
MRRVILFAVGVLAFSTTALAQNDPVAAPVLALPENMRADATVIKWKSDFTYDTLKEGKNGLVCYDRSGFPGQAAFSIECTSMGNLPREAQNLKAQAAGAGDNAKSEAILNAQEKDGTRLKPEYGSVWYHLMGADREHARTHMTIAMPGATAQSTGLPDKRANNGIWIMNAGTTTAHIMVPGE